MSTQSPELHDNGESHEEGQHIPAQLGSHRVAGSRRRERRTRIRTVMQLDEVEAGPAALSMVLSHHRSYPTLTRLRELCGVTRDSASVEDLLHTGRGLGMVAASAQLTVRQLSELKPPVILTWQPHHYVVFEGQSRRLGRSVFHINDPARGRQRMTTHDVQAGFGGTGLAFAPAPGFARVGHPPQPLRGLLGRLRGVRAALAAALLTSLLLGLAGTVAASFTKGFIDTFLTTTYSQPTVTFFSLVAATLALIAVLAVLQQRYLLRAELWTATQDSARFMRHALRLPVNFFYHRRPADIAQRLRLNDSIAQVLNRKSTSLLTSLAIVVSYTALLLHFSPLLAAIGVTGALLKVALARLLVRLRRDAVGKSRLARARLMSTAYGGIQQMETLKATGGEQEFFRRWAGHQATLLHEQQRLGRPSALLASLDSVLGTLTTVGILMVGGLQAVHGGIPVGVLLAFLTVLPAMTRPLGEITGLFTTVQESAADLAMLRDVETADQDSVFSGPAVDLDDRLGSHLRLQDVAFGYSPLAPAVVQGISLEVGPGQQVAIVGASGSGKSTVAKLLAGFYQPRSGRILIDAMPVKLLSRATRAASLAFVDQDVFLFRGTIRENVTLWDPSVPDDAVLRALADACLDDVLASRPGGMHSVVEQDGRNFSGGQRQRLEIARALVRSPSVLVLDEATSALDAATEHQVSVNLRRRGCACVVIAHRLSTVRDSDEILVLDAGQVIERGTHEQLAALGGSYTAMIKEDLDGN